MNIYQASAANAIVLANAATVVARVIQNIAGNDMSSQLNGEDITRQAVVGLTNQYLHRAIQNQFVSAGVKK